MESIHFSVAQDKDSLKVVFKNGSYADNFSRMEFYSRILHSLVPDRTRVWRAGNRLEVEIKGWPKSITWQRTSKLEFAGKITAPKDFKIKEFAASLEEALKGIVEGEPDNGRKLVFHIGKPDAWVEYRFRSKARAIAALCVLYDLESHPRNDLELNIPKNLGLQSWPLSKGSSVVRTYGDPSKTADVLRNEGWARSGDATAMKVFRQNIGGAAQQMYQLLRAEQTVASQVMRTNIPRRWREELFKSQDYTCRICHLKYPIAELDPDHRIPVIVVADELTEDNFKIKLMTLCRFCNQQKRETCKRLPPDYDWKTSPWAYPEKFQLKKIKEEIESYAATEKIKYAEVLNRLKKPN